MAASNGRVDPEAPAPEKTGAAMVTVPKPVEKPKSADLEPSSLPEMPQEDLVKALEWDLKKKFFFNSEENLFGFKEAAAVEGEGGAEKIYTVFYCENKTALPRLEQKKPYWTLC